MSISAVNCTPIKPQVSFGNDKEVEDVQRVLNLTTELKDQFQGGTKTKSNLQTAVSVLGAFAATFVLGKVAASKVLTAFPSLPSKIASGTKAAAAKIKDIQVPEKVLNSKAMKSIKEIAASPKLQSASASVKKLAQKASEYISKKGPETVLKNAAGIASMGILGTQVIKVDGNGDGIADIAQNNVNAYKNALSSVGAIGEIVEAMS